jgi:hypothetical protein
VWAPHLYLVEDCQHVSPTVCLAVLLQGAGLVDELTTCWAMISLKRCAELVRDMTISVPLYTGSIYDPVSTLG